MMNLNEIVDGLRALKQSDFDYDNPEMDGPARLRDLTNAVTQLPNCRALLPELFALMERLPGAELGTPGPLVHAIEGISGYEEELTRSVKRKPTELSVWMLNRLLNTPLNAEIRSLYLDLLSRAVNHPDASDNARRDAMEFLEFQIQGPGGTRPSHQ